MEYFLRFLQFLVKLIYSIVYPLLNFLLPRKNKQNNEIPPIKNVLLTLSITDLLKELKQQKIKSITILNAYIERLLEVNPIINAIVEQRFDLALKEAAHADYLIQNCKNDKDQLTKLFAKYPLLGIPCTIKEACGVAGMSFVVGSLKRMGFKADAHGDAVRQLQKAGAIILLVSANPEYCFSIETNTYTHGKCLNPYDLRRSSGGSSGGEGALNGAGASLFGLGSDIAGSIRIPSLFNGIFGHKPTGGLTSVGGLFPNSTDTFYNKYLQVGPMTRFAQDLKLILQIVATEINAKKLQLSKPIDTKSIKIFFSLGHTGLNGRLHTSVASDIQLAIIKAVCYFQELKLQVQRADIKGFQLSNEIGFSAIARLEDFPFLLNTECQHKILENLWEYVKSLVGCSNYTKDGLLFELLRRTNAFMPKKNLHKYKEITEKLKTEIINLLGDNGVLLFPTFPVPAVHHNSSHLPIWGIDYALIFNVLGLPATHVPMGLNNDGLPVGFQVIAAPFKDNLCLHIACELERKFGGWQPPSM